MRINELIVLNYLEIQNRILKSTPSKENNLPNSIFRRFGHFGNGFLNFIIIFLFTMIWGPSSDNFYTSSQYGHEKIFS